MKIQTLATRLAVPVGVVLVALVVGTVFGRFTSSLNQLDAQAQRNDSFDARGITLASADSIDVDNDFVIAALRLLPSDSSFAFMGPVPATAARFHIAPVTVNALPGYMQYVLMPRREVGISEAGYVLCYACDRSAIPGHVRWLYTAQDGIRIGRRG